jgi:hypothetical protein
MSNGHGNGGGPRPPEVDNVEILKIEKDRITFSGTTADGELVEITRRLSLEYFKESEVGDKFEVTFKPVK